MKSLKKTDIKEGVEILKNGGVIAFPTETVFGLGVIANSKENFDKLVKVKERKPDKPFTLMCYSIDQVKDIVVIDEIAQKLINKFMPGPITLVLPTKTEVEDFFDLNTGFIGVRIPDDEFVLSLLKEVNEPLFVPSANKSGKEPLKTSEEILKVFNNEVDCVYEGKCENNIPSTVAKIDNKNVIILRKGKILESEIKESIND